MPHPSLMGVAASPLVCLTRRPHMRNSVQTLRQMLDDGELWQLKHPRAPLSIAFKSACQKERCAEQKALSKECVLGGQGGKTLPRCTADRACILYLFRRRDSREQELCLAYINREEGKNCEKKKKQKCPQKGMKQTSDNPRQIVFFLGRTLVTLVQLR